MIATSPFSASRPPIPSTTPNISSRIVLSAFESPATLSANGSTAGPRGSPRQPGRVPALAERARRQQRVVLVAGGDFLLEVFHGGRPPQGPQRLVDQFGT